MVKLLAILLTFTLTTGSVADLICPTRDAPSANGETIECCETNQQQTPAGSNMPAGHCPFDSGCDHSMSCICVPIVLIKPPVSSTIPARMTCEPVKTLSSSIVLTSAHLHRLEKPPKSMTVS